MRSELFACGGRPRDRKAVVDLIAHAPFFCFLKIHEGEHVMDIPTDSTFVGALIGGLAVLLGARLGASATIRAARVQFQTEYRTRQTAALAAALMEICRNQPSLIGHLDRVLPLWLSRPFNDGEAGRGELVEVTKSIPKISTSIYDAFFVELIPSPFGAELKTYYDRLGRINALALDVLGGVTPNDFQGYVSDLALAIEVAYDIGRDLKGYVKRSKLLEDKWGKEDYLSGFEDKDSSRRAEYMVALHRTTLADLEKYISDPERYPDIPRLLVESELVLSETNWVKAARALKLKGT